MMKIGQNLGKIAHYPPPNAKQRFAPLVSTNFLKRLVDTTMRLVDFSQIRFIWLKLVLLDIRFPLILAKVARYILIMPTFLTSTS